MRTSFSPPLESAEVQQPALNATAANHDQLLTDFVEVAEADERVSAVEVDDIVLFQPDKEGGLKALELDFATVGLPQPPEDVKPVAVVFSHTDGGTVHSAALFGERADGIVTVRFLEDPKVTAESKELHPAWQQPGHTNIGGMGLHLIKQGQNTKAAAYQVDWRGYPGESKPQALTMLRNQPVVDEKQLANTERTVRRHKVYKRLSQAMAGLALFSAATRLTYDPGPETIEPGAYAEPYEDSPAVQRVQRNLELFKDGDIEALKAEAARSGADEVMVRPVFFEQAEAASSVEELENIVNNAIGGLGINFDVAETGRENQYTKIASFEEAKQATLGALDGVNRLGTQLRDSKFTLRVVGEITPDEDGIVPLGRYQYPTETELPTILIRSHDIDTETADTMVHEGGHYEHLAQYKLSPDFSDLNPEDFEHDEDAEDGKGNYEPGKDVVTAYAGKSEEEEIADIVEKIYGKKRLVLDTENSTIAQEKIMRILAQLENQIPGESARILSHAVPLDQADKGIIGNINEATNPIRKKAEQVFISSLLALAAAGYGWAANDELRKKQQELGLLPRVKPGS